MIFQGGLFSTPCGVLAVVGPVSLGEAVAAVLYMDQVCLGIFSDKVAPFKSPF